MSLVEGPAAIEKRHQRQAIAAARAARAVQREEARLREERDRAVCAFLAPRAEHPNTQARAREDVMFGCSDDYHWMRFGTYLSTVNRLRPRHLQWILARITARNAQHSPLTAAARSHLVGFKNSFPFSIQHGARP